MEPRKPPVPYGRGAICVQEDKDKTTMSGQPEGISMTFLRIWLWVVPIVMLVVSGVFGVIAALDESWSLLAVMVAMGFFAIGLLVLHWWAMYRFGRQAPR